MNLKGLLDKSLVFDIETSAKYPDGREVNINSNFDDYLNLAVCKWIGIYSFRDNKEYYLEVSKDRQKIVDLLDSHDTFIGFNSEEFDYPILVNNGLINSEKWVRHIDCMKILGSSKFLDKKGNKYKDRGSLMGYKFKKNSLECMAETMELEFQKSTIDYKIFQKNEYTEEEKKEIIKYLKNDVLATKGLFDKLFDYWKPFTDMLDWKDVSNFSWIRSSIASLIYKSACYGIGLEATYSDSRDKIKEEMGGNVLEPKYEEAENVWYIDFGSLYPHIFCMFNLFAEVDKDTKGAWHGNDLFQVKGYYDVSYEHPLSTVVKKKLKQRMDLKKSDPESPMVYTLKIWLNGLYGIVRSSIFEKVHTPNAGWDCCWLGQQLQKFVQDELEKKGYESIYGDTDSLFIKCNDKKHNDKDYITNCLKSIIQKIFDNVPFPVDTFDMGIEKYVDYILFPFSDEPVLDEETRKILNKDITNDYEITKEDGKKVIREKSSGKIVKKGRSWIKHRTGKKKNYFYLYQNDGEMKYEIVGLPIKKDNATPLGLKIFNDVLKPKILEQKRGKFDKEFIDDQINEYLKYEEIMKLCAVEFNVKSFKSYKVEGALQAQISKEYFGGGEGVISLIKNKKVGKVGKGNKYCTVEEAIRNQLTAKDLVLEKVYNELEPFIKT